MAEDAPAPAAEESQTLVVHPGDVVQITDNKLPAVGCLLIVEGCYGWGVGATLRWVGANGGPMESYHRLRPGQFAVIGGAAVVKPNVLAARRDSVGTEQLVRSEQG